MKERPPANYREAFATPEESRQLGLLLDHLFDAGFIMINTCSAAISTAMGEEEIDALVAATAEGLQNLE
jgi:glutamate-1-semialdehyde 2,1-aminomutase